jgi:hypothetical protein
VSASSTSLDLLIGIMCRKVELFHTSDVNYTRSIATKRFTPAKTTFDVDADPKNRCYKTGHGPELPPGADYVHEWIVKVLRIDLGPG